KSQIQDIARNCDPKLNISLKEFNKILIIEVQEGADKPYKCGEGFYLRVGPNSQKMTRDEIINMSVKEDKIRFDEQINDEFVYPYDFDDDKLNNYLSLANISKTIPEEKILIDLNVAKKNKTSKLNNAGVLMFAKKPQKFVSYSIFTCVSFKDKEGSDIIDRREIEGSLIEVIEDVMKFVEKNIRVAYRFTGKLQRENVYEYPLGAIREAVINSVMHRDYFEKGHNNLLRIFPDKITITNVWLKPSWFKIGRDTFRRNNIIADLFLRIHLIEKVGSGFARMEEFCQNVRAPVFKLDLDEKYFRIIFYKSKDYLELATGEKVTEKVTENQRKILDSISKDSSVTVKELSKIAGISERKIKENIAKLKKKGLLKRIGPAKGGHWKVILR
ncbi:MAG: winged helix-turn-helix transcriptional regulator, partial [Nanoarchaeota archaeon]|nr:winged helix-turn-helix transcriptional regulator [Nanoarchaeota archaeon]